MLGDWFMMFDDAGHLLCYAETAWLDGWRSIPPPRVFFAPIEDEV